MRSANGTAAKRARAGKPKSRFLTEVELRLREEKHALAWALNGEISSSNGLTIVCLSIGDSFSAKESFHDQGQTGDLHKD